MALPTGPAVAFLFTDIEGSTRTERAVGSAAWADVVARHDELMRRAIEGHAGSVVKTEGDAFFAAFAGPADAVAAATEAQRALAAELWPADAGFRVRMGIHLGEGRLRARSATGEAEDYVGIDVNYAARIAAAANGGQIVLSGALVAALPSGLEQLPGMHDVGVVEDGLRAVKDFDEPAPLYRLVVPGVADDERPLRTTDVPSNLPGDVTSLVGRETEIELVHRDLDAARIVTLTGAGGSGKTRLAIAAARDCATASRTGSGSWTSPRSRMPHSSSPRSPPPLESGSRSSAPWQRRSANIFVTAPCCSSSTTSNSCFPQWRRWLPGRSDPRRTSACFSPAAS